MHNKKRIKAMIVDDHPVVRKGIRMILEDDKKISVCAEASNADEAIQLINSNEPDLAIVDIELSGVVNGIDLIKSINKRFPHILTLVLSIHNDLHYAERAIRAGAKGYVKKEDAPDKIVEAIHSVVEGSIFLNDNIKDIIIQKLAVNSIKSESITINSLSDREFEIFQFLGKGCRSKEISNMLNISIFTVESHKRNMKKKLKFENNDALIKYAIQWNKCQ